MVAVDVSERLREDLGLRVKATQEELVLRPIRSAVVVVVVGGAWGLTQWEALQERVEVEQHPVLLEHRCFMRVAVAVEREVRMLEELEALEGVERVVAIPFRRLLLPELQTLAAAVEVAALALRTEAVRQVERALSFCRMRPRSLSSETRRW